MIALEANLYDTDTAYGPLCIRLRREIFLLVSAAVHFRKCTLSVHLFGHCHSATGNMNHSLFVFEM